MADYRTLADLAADMQVTPRWLRELVRRRGIQVLRIGRVILLDDAAVRKLGECLCNRP